MNPAAWPSSAVSASRAAIPIPIAAEKYVCPINCDTIWYRQFAGQDIPICETQGHKVKLIPAREATC